MSSALSFAAGKNFLLKVVFAKDSINRAASATESTGIPDKMIF